MKPRPVILERKKQECKKEGFRCDGCNGAIPKGWKYIRRMHKGEGGAPILRRFHSDCEPS